MLNDNYVAHVDVTNLAGNHITRVTVRADAEWDDFANGFLAALGAPKRDAKWLCRGRI